ncbi:site-specific integrase [Kitasatospora aureofaciens]|uniref:site-specific integrase n=1 Tax=Kitasatospora aureofaciens TaxID=1894 RepID=UPI0033F9852C
MLALLCADVVRPDFAWLARRRMTPAFRKEIAHSRDPEGFALLEARVPEQVWTSSEGCRARTGIAAILVTKGGRIRDITVGDVLEAREAASPTWNNHTAAAYLWLRDWDLFPSDSPATLRQMERHAGQVSVAQLVDRYQLRCQPVRDLIVEYLAERQPALDYASLEGLSRMLAFNFWSELEVHNPGISSLELSAEVAAGWKARQATKTTRKRQPDGTFINVTVPRGRPRSTFTAVRSFYLDLAQWAAEDPARWGRWAVRCPITMDEISVKKQKARVKARMDQRTRERLPVLPVLVRTARQQLEDATTRLKAVRAAAPGAAFTVLGETYTRTKMYSGIDPDRQCWVRDTQGTKIHLGLAEHRVFWTWAAIEVLRHTGVRIEEMLELSHHSIIQYTLPSSGEVVPLLQIAPSKLDEERLLLVTPELADVLATIVSRVRGTNGSIPLVVSYDIHERSWNPPMPLLFQWSTNSERRAIGLSTVRKGLVEVLEASGLTNSIGEPLIFQPHDFRRIFITDAVQGGLPPHIAQVIAGHKDIGTTMHYLTIYPQQAIEAHRAFIARRRSERPSEEYRTPTPDEWESFLGHFERRKLALGTCGRAYGSDCVHEHACVRCPVLLVSPSELPRLEEIRDNLTDRIREAEREGWLGEVDGLNVSLAAAKEKIAQLAAQQERRSSVVHLGLPTFPQIAARAGHTPVGARQRGRTHG